ncbi:DUF6259 domain-containing protein [Paenibacillus brevis]|uniref:DUF6259 domain-containing protein n=1 Tax=Paenibacillus brevis TaxID=2841508 RepID=A0ABS6FNF5_9BACL|nr:hypothetical protein [Paenibacillus brevis]
MIELENGILSIGMSKLDGSVISLRDLRSGVEYIAPESRSDAFRLETENGMSGAWSGFAYELRREAGRQECLLRWVCEAGPIVHAAIVLEDGSGAAEFRCRAEASEGISIVGLDYPIIPDLRNITEEGEDDYIAHSFATGIQVRNPLRHFAENGSGMRHMPYPESFSGASMQFFAYYGLGQGGLYFAALDHKGYAKWLNFYKNPAGWLEASFFHAVEEIEAGKGVCVTYPVVVQLLRGEGWHEAAELYKSWAKEQPWCAKGTLGERRDRDDETLYRWLYEEAGVATFGINAGYDRTAWLRKYHEHIGTPMFHILGPDWTHAPQTFGKGVPGGYDDWFPTRFNRSNLDYMRELGDKFAPFEFDYLFNFAGADGERGKAAAQKFPEQVKSIDAYRFPFLCPAAPYTRELHRRRDETLQLQDDVDAIYYDISANNILKVCLDGSHGHPVGAGRAITEAYRSNYAETKEAMIQAAGRYVPMGTEMMNEVFLRELDFYQARAGGQPAAPLEGYPFRELFKTGDAVLIPMFTYVYHEYGPVRMDGWGKLTEEIGDLFYYTVARTYLWGGLYELNYEYSPMEALDGTENRSDEHYADFEPRGYAFSEERARYVGMYAGLRTGAANKYLAYGTMLPPLPLDTGKVPLDTGKVPLDWFHYNHGIHSPEYNDSGSLAVERVVHAAWQYRDESIGLFFAGIGTGTERVNIRWEDIPGGEKVQEAVCRCYSAEAEYCAETVITAGDGFMLEIPPRSVVMLEIPLCRK